MSEWPFVIAAYTVCWVGVIGYGLRLYLLHRRARRLAEDLGGDA